ncbi:hypothetical protein C8Q78DRAFT_1020664 [Trametes maxima]|nr:hypothetical protein C8Q78DRAFT_1020664 [Trametes maxima]
MSISRTKAPGAVLGGDPYVIPDGILDDIDDSWSWNRIVSQMCDDLKIPDLTTRHGLKRVHARFNDIYRRLDATYSRAQKKGNVKVMGGVVGIMAKMCADSILRDKLFQKGLLSKVMPLLEFDVTRHVALQALTVVTHHGGLPARQEIAKHNPTLAQLLRRYPDDPKVAELVIVTVAHATEAVVACEETPDPTLVRAAKIQDVLEATVAALRKPTGTHILQTHALSLLVAPTQHCPRDCKAVPSMLTLLAALTRSKNINTRATAFSGLLRLSIAESEFEHSQFDPMRLMSAAQRGTPRHLSDVLMTYGPERAEVSLTLRATLDYQKGMMQAMKDRNMYALGTKLVDIIQRTEFAIGEGGWQTQGPDGTWGLLGDSAGLPFTRWTDALPLSAKAMRAKGTPADLDGADIIEMKFYMIRGRLPEAIALANATLKRGGGLAYAYYIVSMGGNVEEGLRAVKKGLKCKNVTPFVRNQMLWRAVNHAAQQGLTILRESREGDMQSRAEGLASLMSAWEDAKAYISEAPPDGRHMLEVLSWYVILTIVTRGPELDVELSELDPARRKIQTSKEFMNHMGYPIQKTQLNVTRDLLLSIYTKGAREWADFVKRFDDLDTQAQECFSNAPSDVEDGLAEWLEKVELADSDDGHGHAHHHARSHAFGNGHPMPTPKVETRYELYRCTWCGNPSAALRKCSGCGKTKYCDVGCQKSHWSEHKAKCKGRS